MQRVPGIPFSPGLARLGQWALRAIGPLVLVVLLLRVVDYEELRDVLGGMRLSWALAALAIVQLIIVLRSLRWIEIHRAFGLGTATFLYQLRLSYATSIAALVLPQILSPFSRLALLLQDGYPARRAAGGAAVEKIFEAVAYIAFGLYGSIFLASVFGGLVWWAGGLALVVGAVAAGAYLGRKQLTRLAAWLIGRVPGMTNGDEGDPSTVTLAAVSLNARVLVVLLAWSLLVALAQATLLFALSRSLGVDLSYPFMVAVWGIVALSMLLPISINGVGTREAILVIAFDAAEKSTDAAVALGLLVVVALAVGASPGVIEWLWRFVGGGRRVSGGQVAEAPPVGSAPPAAPSEGEAGR